ncbi:MAG: glutaredoxin domain-containing protein [Rubrivivax sp.]|nr:glutaredoxin domain-containing protein [Rubrivivax sp.]
MKPMLVRTLAAVLLAWPACAALAQYKIVHPDGSVTYTDRPPTEGSARVTQMGRNAAPAAPEAGLPIELRQAAQRYPVTLYAAPDCPPCDNGRRLLQQRGIPYAERRILGEEDAQALERIVGGRTVPALAIGPQQLRGFSETDWTSYLDAAGYPRESRLPRDWPQTVPTPLAERAPPARAAAPAPAPAEPRPVEPAPTGGVRF